MFNNILLPFFGMLLLTFAVWLHMYARRLHFLVSNKVDTEQLKTPAAGEKVVPADVSYAAYNFRNLFELPVLYYALCLYALWSGHLDSVIVFSAWWFFIFRIGHSAVHCTFNNVKLRFLLYMVSAAGLWVMLGRTIWIQLQG